MQHSHPAPRHGQRRPLQALAFVALLGLAGCRAFLPVSPATGDVQVHIEVPEAQEPDVRVVAYLEPTGEPAPGQAEPAVPADVISLQLRGSDIVPGFAAMVAGQRILFRSDGDLHHRLFSYDEGNEFELRTSETQEPSLRLRHAGAVHVYCSLHPGERATLFVAPNPWFIVLQSTQTWLVPDVPAGTYRLVGWGGPARSARHDVIVRPGEVSSLELALESAELAD